MRIADFDRLLISNAHFPDLSAIDGEVLFPLEMSEELSELELDVFESLLLSNPHWQLSFHFLCIQEATLVNKLILLLEVYCLPSRFLFPHLLRKFIIEVVIHFSHHPPRLIPLLQFALSIPACFGVIGWGGLIVNAILLVLVELLRSYYVYGYALIVSFRVFF